MDTARQQEKEVDMRNFLLTGGAAIALLCAACAPIDAPPTANNSPRSVTSTPANTLALKNPTNPNSVPGAGVTSTSAITTASSYEVVPTPNKGHNSTTTSADSLTCRYPDDIDSAGRRCGARAASVRPGGALGGIGYSGYSGGSTYVRGYYRKDGTYVRGHTRRRR